MDTQNINPNNLLGHQSGHKLEEQPQGNVAQPQLFQPIDIRTTEMSSIVQEEMQANLTNSEDFQQQATSRMAAEETVQSVQVQRTINQIQAPGSNINPEESPAKLSSHQNLTDNLLKLPDSKPRMMTLYEEEFELGDYISGLVYIDADTYQACQLNKLLPKGFKLEVESTVRKFIEQRHKQKKNQIKNQAKNEKTQQKMSKQISSKESKYNTYQIKEDSRQDFPKAIDQKLEAPALTENGSAVSQAYDPNQSLSGIDLGRQPSRASGRQRTTVDYAGMAAGTSKDSVDQSDFQAQAAKNQGQRPKGMKVNSEILKKCQDYFKRFRESSELAAVQQALVNINHVSSSLQDLVVLEQNLNEFKYSNTHFMMTDMRQFMLELSKSIIATKEPTSFVALSELQVFNDGLINEYKLFGDSQIYQQQISQAAKHPAETSQRQKIPQMKPASKPKAEPKQQQQVSSYNLQNVQDEAMTIQEKAELKKNIERLTQSQQNGIIGIVQSCIAQNGKGDVFEFELDQLPPKKCRELQAYVKDCFKENVKKAKRKEADAKRREKQKSNRAAQSVSSAQQSVNQQITPQNKQIQPDYENLDVATLSQLLIQNPSIQISQAKRQDVLNYQSFLRSQQMQQTQPKLTNLDQFSSSSSSDSDEDYPTPQMQAQSKSRQQILPPPQTTYPQQRPPQQNDLSKVWAEMNVNRNN